MSACPSCREIKTKVMETKVLKNGWVWRRRKCLYDCGTLFRTFEIPEDFLSISPSEDTRLFFERKRNKK